LATMVADALTHVAIAAEKCTDASACFEVVKRRRFEVVFVDFSSASELIEAIRSSPSNRTAVLIAITDNSEHSNRAFGTGVHFVLQQPVSRSSIDSILRAAYGLIMRERRRYFRCPLEVAVVGQRPHEDEWSGHSINISEGGIC